MRSQLKFRPDTFDHALQAQGWRFRVDGSTWRRGTDTGSSQLREVGVRGQWRHFELSGRRDTRCWAGEHSVHQPRIAGAGEVCGAGATGTTCRVDVPESVEWVSHADCCRSDFRAVDQPFATWVSAIEAVVGGAGATPPTDDIDDSLAERTAALLRDAGYAVSVDGQRLQVHVSYGGVYRQMWTEAGRVSVEIVNLDGYCADSRRSALSLIQEANQRLPLVRFGAPHDAPETVIAEIVWGAIANSTVWLPLSIACVDSAVALTARELEAVHDPQLGKLVVALATA